jgi:gliding motility-associated-like protein
MIVQIKRIILLLGIFLLPIESVFSQSHVSKNNYTGNWTTPTSWSPTWSSPQTNILGYDITINGYITLNGPLSFSILRSNLIINDTLVINGNLTLGLLTNLTINGNGILIVRGNLTMGEYSNIITNNYIVVTGNFTKIISPNNGSFISNNNPSRVFIGGNISPTGITNHKSHFPALNCTAPITIRYPHSNCTYGDMTDIITDPIYPFFLSTCTIGAPTITPDGPTTFCAGGSVNLTSSTGITYLWSSGATTRSINVTASNSYTVQVTNTSGCHSAASAAIVVTVNALPITPTITASGPTTFCAGGSVTLTSSPEAAYLWSNGATSQSINISTAGSYTLRVKNANGCQSAVSAATLLNVNALPIVNAGTDKSISNGTSTTINATVTGTGPFAYSWSPSSKLVNASIKDPTTVNLDTTTVFALTATSLTTSCSNIDEVTITITGVPLNSTPTANPGTICAGTNVQLHALAFGGSGSYTYTWTSTPSGFSSSIANPIANPVVNTTYYVAVSDGFTTVNRQVAETVNPLPATPTITASGPTTFCNGNSVILTSSPGTIYLWSNGTTTQGINITTAGSYTVQITSASGCKSAASAATVVTVNDLPVTPAIKVSGPSTFCDGDSVTLTSSAGTGNLWSNGATTQSINITTSGSYTVQATNAYGCLSIPSLATVVSVTALPLISASNNGPVCTGNALNLTGGPAGMTIYYWTGPDDFTSLIQNPSVSDSATLDMAGLYTLTVADVNGCTNIATQSIIVNETPVAVAGPDQNLKFNFETQMNAELSASETGDWSLISGTGHFSDIHSPTTRVTELSAGENKFLWKVLNGNCEDTAEVKITVHDLFVPSVITPNGDGKNDYFKISEFSGKAELIIFNRWGNEEYTNANYLNDWDGRNNKGAELPADTYFYILKFENGKIKKGSVLIKR